MMTDILGWFTEIKRNVWWFVRYRWRLYLYPTNTYENLGTWLAARDGSIVDRDYIESRSERR